MTIMIIVLPGAAAEVSAGGDVRRVLEASAQGTLRPPGQPYIHVI